MSMTRPLFRHLRRFIAARDGYVTIEALIAMPVLLWIFAAAWVYFDVFRQQSVNQKANYVIGDMISRETDPIDESYVDSAMKLLTLLNKSQTGDSDLRITVARYEAEDGGWQVVWSEARGDQSPLNGALAGYADRLPPAMDADQVILVETWDAYSPIFAVGLADFEITSYSFTRPRFAPQVVFGEAANG